MSRDTTPFTQYVRAVASEETVGAEVFQAAYQALRAALANELKRRGLWGTSPSYLGVLGWASWSERVSDGPRTLEALDELLPECYHFIFIRRLRSLCSQQLAKGNIDGLVFLGIRNFLHDTQRKHDPLGFRVFELLRQVIDSLIEEELLFSDGGRINNEALLSFSINTGSDVSEGLDLSSLIVPVWSNSLLPDLLTAQGRDLEGVLQILRSLLLDLRESGVPAFRLRQVLEPFKQDIRVRWGTLFGETQGPTAFEDGDQETPRLVPVVGPDLDVEDRDSFHKLFLAVSLAIEERGADPKSVRYLRVLWGFLRMHAHNGLEKLPSQRQLSKRLRIPRERLPKLFATLGRLVREQKSARSSDSPVIER